MTIPTTLSLHVITPEGRYDYGDLTFVSLPTPVGQITIRPSHIALATSVVTGDVVWTSSTEYEALASYADHTEHTAIGNGIAMIENNTITILISR